MENRTVMQRDDRKIQEHLSHAGLLAAPVNSLLKELNRLELGAFTLADVQRFAADPAAIEADVRQRVVGEENTATVGGLRLNRSAVLEMVEIPDVTNAKRAAAALAGALTTLNRNGQYGRVAIAQLELVNGKAQVTETARQQITDRFTVYADNEEQEEAFKILSEVKEKLDYLMQKYYFPLIIQPVPGTCLRSHDGMYGGGPRVEIVPAILKQNLHKRTAKP